MTSSQISAIAVREQRIAWLEQRLEERENTIADLADRAARLAVEVATLRGGDANIHR